MACFSNDDDRLAALVLWRCKGIGPVTFRHFIRKLDYPAQFLDPALMQEMAEKLPVAAREDFQRPKQRQALIAAAEKDLAWARQQGRHIIFDRSPDYPAMLLPFADAAPILFVLGEPRTLSMPQIAIVGTRSPSSSGRENARRFAQVLTEHGLLITSGMALGVDGCAHEGALAAKGQTVGILAHGLDSLYPKTHSALARRVLEQGGALVSEFPLGVTPRRECFPRRNRIMSALSLGVLVVEAAIKSGSLITARMALQQGKEVFAIPGSIQNAHSRGCHQLIRDGATLVETVRDIYTVIAPLMQQELLGEVAMPYEQSVVETSFNAEVGASDQQEAEHQHLRVLNLLDPVERTLYEALNDEPSTIDQLVVRTGSPPEQLLTQLMVLELKALVQTVPGGYRRQSAVPP